MSSKPCKKAARCCGSKKDNAGSATQKPVDHSPRPPLCFAPQSFSQNKLNYGLERIIFRLEASCPAIASGRIADARAISRDPANPAGASGPWGLRSHYALVARPRHTSVAKQKAQRSAGLFIPLQEERLVKR